MTQKLLDVENLTMRFGDKSLEKICSIMYILNAVTYFCEVLK